jgi:hypothetical protein
MINEPAHVAPPAASRSRTDQSGQARQNLTASIAAGRNG